MKKMIRRWTERFLKALYCLKYGMKREDCCARIKSADKKEFAIVIQGPVTEQMHLICIRMMSWYHKNAYIILSTWDNTDPALLKKAGLFVDQILLNQIPQKHIDTRNFQIVSARNGIKEAKRLGYSHVLKSRTDIVLERDALHLYQNRKRMFPEDSTVKQYGLYERLLIFSPRIYYYYRCSDFVMMGQTDDMETYWDCVLENRDAVETENPSVIAQSKGLAAPEEYLSVHFAEKIGYPLQFTLRDNLRYFSTLFWPAGKREWGLVWLKSPIPVFFRLKISIDLICLRKREWEQLYQGNRISLAKVDVERLRPNSKISAWRVHRLFV